MTLFKASGSLTVLEDKGASIIARRVGAGEEEEEEGVGSREVVVSKEEGREDTGGREAWPVLRDVDGEEEEPSKSPIKSSLIKCNDIQCTSTRYM